MLSYVPQHCASHNIRAVLVLSFRSNWGLALQEGMMRTQTNGKKANGSSDALSLAVATEEAREPLASE